MGPGIRERERVMQNQLLSVCTRGPALPAAWEEEKRQLWPLTSDTSWPGGLGLPRAVGRACPLSSAMAFPPGKETSPDLCPGSPGHLSSGKNKLF